MKWGPILGITFLVLLMILFEWPRMSPKQKKEKIAFLALASTGWVLGVLLVFFPDLPGPTQLFEALFKPLGKLLEQ